MDARILELDGEGKRGIGPGIAKGFDGGGVEGIFQ